MTPPLQVDRKNILGELPLYTLIFIFNMADKKVKNEFSLPARYFNLNMAEMTVFAL